MKSQIVLYGNIGTVTVRIWKGKRRGYLEKWRQTGCVNIKFWALWIYLEDVARQYWPQSIKLTREIHIVSHYLISLLTSSHILYCFNSTRNLRTKVFCYTILSQSLETMRKIKKKEQKVTMGAKWKISIIDIVKIQKFTLAKMRNHVNGTLIE